MKKRMLSLALALVLALGLLPATASAAKSSATVTQVVPYKYYRVGDFSEGLAVVGNDGGGVIDKTGKEVIPCGTLRYSALGDSFHDGRLAVLSAKDLGHGEGWCEFYVGYVDTTGKEVIPCTYITNRQPMGNVVENLLASHRFQDGVAVLGSKGDIGSTGSKVIDQNGNEVVPSGKYNGIGTFSEGLAAVCVGEWPEKKWGFIDTAGNEVIPCQYESAEAFQNGRAVVRGNTGRVENGKTVYGYGVIDTAGNTVVPFGKYAFISGYHDGLAEVRKDRNRGFIDTAGKEVIPCQYENVGPFSGSLAAVKTNSRWGFIDKTGKRVIPCQYKEVEPFSEGLAAVKTNSGWGYIDLHGNEVIPCQHGEARQLSEGMLAVDLDGKWGFVRVEGLPTEPKAVQTVTDDVTPDKAADNTAYAATQTVVVDGQNVTFNAYALKDANGYATNYIKLRDVADVLNGSLAQFQVGWDGQITITTQAAYTPNGTEMVKNFEGDQTYSVNQSTVTVNGKQVNLEAITLTDDTGGYTYFKLRDLGEALGFNVGWDNHKGIFVETDKPYDANN